VELFGFYDVVRIENLDFGTPDPKRTLESVGGGLRFRLRDGLRAEFTYAKPLDKALFTDPARPPERLLFSITTKLPALFQ
jgi:hemolysin activation/secretion protein